MATKKAPPPAEPGARLSWEEAAAYIGPSVSPGWVRRQVYAGKLDSKLLGGRVFIEKQALDAFIAEAPTKPSRKRSKQARVARAQRAQR